jgi:hypothetical protein
MALTDAAALLVTKYSHLLSEDTFLGFAVLYFGPFATADGTGNKAEWVMPFAGHIVEVLYGAETDSADADFNVEIDGTDIWAADKADLGAGVFNAEPDTILDKFNRGSKVRIDISAAGTSVVNGVVAIVVAYRLYGHGN